MDIRLTETSTVEEIWQKICGKRALRASASEIVSRIDAGGYGEDNPQILAYELAEQVAGRKIVFEQISGATDARLLRKKGRR